MSCICYYLTISSLLADIGIWKLLDYFVVLFRGLSVSTLGDLRNIEHANSKELY